MKTRRLSNILVPTVALALGMGAVSCMKYEKKANTSTSGTTTMVCDNTFENIFEQEVDVFEYQYPDAHILVRYATQQEAFDSLFTMNTRTIVAARDITEAERKALKAKYKNERNANVNVRSAMIAVDAVALIVNPKNSCEKLTVGEVADIVGGRTTEWNQLEPNGKGNIRVVIDILQTRFFMESALAPMCTEPALSRKCSNSLKKTPKQSECLVSAG